MFGRQEGAAAGGFGGGMLEQGRVVQQQGLFLNLGAGMTPTGSGRKDESSASSPVRGGKKIWNHEHDERADELSKGTYQTALCHTGWNDVYHHSGLGGVLDVSGKDVEKKDSGVVKMGRRQGWIHFLALDSSKDICIQALMEGCEDVSLVHSLLKDNCKAMKSGLGVDGLLLGTGDGAHIYWDDADAQMERLPMTTVPRKGTERKKKIQQVSSEKEEGMRIKSYPAVEEHGGDHDEQLARYDWRVPCVEMKVMRIVGAPFLDSVTHDVSVEDGPGEYSVTSFVHAGARGGSKATSTIGTTGGVLSGDSLRISASQVTSTKDAVHLEVYKSGSILVACGSVLVSELQRLAARSDALGQEPPPSLLKQLITPTGWKRKDSGGSMIWAKLTANDGSPAGHVLLAAKARPVDISEAGALGPSSAHNSEGNRYGAMVHAAPMLTETTRDLTCNNQKEVDADLAGYNPMLQQDDGDDEQHVRPYKDTVPQATKQYGSIVGGYLQVNARHVYDVLLDCALRSSDCHKPGSSLEMHPEWSWLTQNFAVKHNIRDEYATLSYLQWVLENHCIKPNSMCFEVISIKYTSIRSSSDAQNGLQSHEVAMYSKVRQDIKSLLNRTFENYYALRQNYDDDVEYLTVRGSQAATVLRSALKLLKLVFSGDDDGARKWSVVRFRRAANKRFYSILAAIEAQIRTNPSKDRFGSANNAYQKIGELCRSIAEEIRGDEGIEQALSSSEGVRLAVHTSLEYCKGISSHIKSVLSRYPPRKPTGPAIQLVQAVGGLQDFVERHQYVDAAIQLDSYEVFRPFVSHWISSSSSSLRRGINLIDENTGPQEAKWKDLHESKGNMVVPFAEVLLRQLQTEMEIYHPILCFWPSYASEIEAACVEVLRLAVSVTSGHCGLVQSLHGKDPSKRRIAWKWTVSSVASTNDESVTEAISRGTNVQQALLMNTLRRLLAVIPQIESSIYKWCQETPDSKSFIGDESPQKRNSLAAFPRRNTQERLAQEVPMLGAQWAQLVKEIRTQYYASITLTAESISRQLTSSNQTSIQHILRKSGLESSDSAVVRRTERILDQTSPTLRILSSTLDSRVFVALARGLWDLTAKQILQYAEDLQEDGAGRAWKGRQNAAAVLSCVENFYKHELSACMGSDLQAKDLAPPQHYQRASALLANTTTQIDKSFDVY